MTGFIVFAHGSRVESANQAVREVAGKANGRVIEWVLSPPIGLSVVAVVEK